MWLVGLLVVAIVFIIIATAKLKMHPFLALLIAAFGFGILSGEMSLADVVNSVNTGFGKTIGYIGIVILAGTIIGTFLEKSGGAYRLADSTLKITGEKNVPLAMAIVGYIVSMPVFCDSGFVILSPLNKALSKKAGITLAASAVALSLGLYATHTMVPPTPGPIAAAGIVNADLGLVIMWGVLVSAIALAVGVVFAVKYASKIDIAPYTEEEEKAIAEAPSSDERRPSTIMSLLPILLPIILIVVRSLANLESKPLGSGDVFTLIQFFGQPVVALLIGVGIATLLPEKLEKNMLSGAGWVGEAVLSAATIIIITGAGGAFGKVLQNSGIAKHIGDMLSGSNVGIWLPFILAAGIKTAQGSSTVSIITTAGIMAPLMTSLGLESDTARALVVVAIGAGAMVVSHANDSYFWVVTQFSNMDVKQGYKLQTLGTLVEGATAAVAIWVISLIVL
jgi:GntP family gluconate:H+ symporter